MSNLDDLIDVVVTTAFELNERGALPVKVADDLDALKLVRRPWRPWSRYENQLAVELEAALRSEAERLISHIREEGEQGAQSEAYWYHHQETLRQAIEPTLSQIARYGVQRAQNGLGEAQIGVNWNLVNDNALSWAHQHAGTLSGQVAATSHQRVMGQIAEWIEAGETMPQLIQRVSGLTDQGVHIFTPNRAEGIAITEATNAYAEGNSIAWVGAGYPMPQFKPAAHVRCRCYLQPFRGQNGEKSVVWYTANDEIVCRSPIDTPWGRVEGCRALHRVIVGGDRVGQKL